MSRGRGMRTWRIERLLAGVPACLGVGGLLALQLLSAERLLEAVRGRFTPMHHAPLRATISPATPSPRMCEPGGMMDRPGRGRPRPTRERWKTAHPHRQGRPEHPEDDQAPLGA